MPSHFYFRFCSFATTFFITNVSAVAPSKDTPLDEQVTCVYPMSGQYGLLPRILFYASLVFAVFGQKFEWLVIGALASAMTFGATAFIHIIIILAMPGRRPPILDLDTISIALVAVVSVNMFPLVMSYSSTMERNSAGRAVVTFWFFIMAITGILAITLVVDVYGSSYSDTAEVACFLPDNTLLTSLAQLNGSRDLGCIYDCFLERGSVLKELDAATVIPGAPALSNLVEWPMIFCIIFTGIMIPLGIFIACMGRCCTDMPIISFLSTVMWSPLVILTEISIRNFPVEENYNAVGQWGPWVGATFAIIGALIYQWMEFDEGNRENRSSQDILLDESVVDYLPHNAALGAASQRGSNIPTGILRRQDRSHSTHASHESLASLVSNHPYTMPPPRGYPEADNSHNGLTPMLGVHSVDARRNAIYAN